MPDNPGMSVTHPIADPASLTVYGADWCGDCRRTKRLLAEFEVGYDWIDVAAHPEIRAELTANGYPAIPVVVLPGGSTLMEPSNDQLEAALAGAGLISPSGDLAPAR